jgi:hypothetical protein
MGRGLRGLLWYCGVGCLLNGPCSSFRETIHWGSGGNWRSWWLHRSFDSSIHLFITLLVSIKVIAIEIILFLVVIKLLFALDFFDRKLHSFNTIETHLDPTGISTPCLILIEFGSPPPSTWPTTFFLQSSGFRLGASIGFLECAVAPDDREMLVIT